MTMSLFLRLLAAERRKRLEALEDRIKDGQELERKSRKNWNI